MKNKRKSAEPVLDRNGLSFEQAIQRLERIVADMEGAELPLDDVLKKYEEGTRLVRFCNLKLEEAEKKIELLTKKADGRIALEPFEAATKETETDEANAEDESGKLF
jgi:exodeoxyribonuclease VII small subunit